MNNKKRIMIQLCPLVQNIDNFERTLILLQQNSIYVDNEKFHVIIDATLLTTDYLTNWNESIIKKDFFIDKFNFLKKYCEWASEVHFNVNDSFFGVLDLCVFNINKYDVDNIVWLDTDIIFGSTTLATVLNSTLVINNTKYIITPEITKWGDTSWDKIVNVAFLNKPFEYHKTNNAIVDTHSKINNKYTLESIDSFKFGGGWFICYSKELLNFIQFPKDLQGYAPIDTYIMDVCSIYYPTVIQYKIKGLIVSHDFKCTNKDTYSKYIKTIDRRYDKYKESSLKMVESINKHKTTLK